MHAWPVFSGQTAPGAVFVLKPQDVPLLGRAAVDGAQGSQGRKGSAKEQSCPGRATSLLGELCRWLECLESLALLGGSPKAAVARRRGLDS